MYDRLIGFQMVWRTELRQFNHRDSWLGVVSRTILCSSRLTWRLSPAQSWLKRPVPYTLLPTLPNVLYRSLSRRHCEKRENFEKKRFLATLLIASIFKGMYRDCNYIFKPSFSSRIFYLTCAIQFGDKMTPLRSSCKDHLYGFAPRLLFCITSKKTFFKNLYQSYIEKYGMKTMKLKENI